MKNGKPSTKKETAGLNTFNWTIISGHHKCSIRKGVPRNFSKFSGKYLYQSLFFNKIAGLRSQACNFIKKKTLAYVFSCEFWEISKKSQQTNE